MLIRHGTLIDPATHRIGGFDLRVENGRIAAVAPHGELRPEPGEPVFDASGHWVLPGLVDMHVHLREPGQEHKETIESGTRSAVAGGVTSVACMANTDPVNDSAAVTEFILDRARAAGLARVYPIGAVSVGLRGERLAEMGEMRDAGIVAVSDDGRPVTDPLLMRRALEYARMLDLPVIAHEEDPALCCGGVMNEGPTSFRLGLPGRPPEAEEIMVARDVALLRRTRGRLHIAHASTAGTVEIIRRAREAGLAVTAEVTPHHFTLTEEAVGEYDTNAKMAPPLRGEADVAALVEGLRDGTITVIASDHAPHHPDEKAVEFTLAPDGIIGLETLLPLSLELVRREGVPLETVVAALTVNPARLLGIAAGTLAEGAPADVAIVDPDCEWTLDATRLQSRSRNTPFDGWTLRGRVVATLVGGRLVWELPGGVRRGGDQGRGAFSEAR